MFHPFMTLSRQHVARSPRGRCQNDALAASAPKRVSLKCTSSRNELRFQRVRVVFRLFCWHSGSTPRLTPRPRHPLCFHPSPHPDPSRSQTPAPTRPSVWFRACRQEGNTATPVVCSAPPLPRESGAPSPHPQPHSPPLAASPPPKSIWPSVGQSARNRSLKQKRTESRACAVVSFPHRAHHAHCASADRVLTSSERFAVKTTNVSAAPSPHGNQHFCASRVVRTKADGPQFAISVIAPHALYK